MDRERLLKIIETTPVLLSFALSLTLGVAGASGQNISRKNKRHEAPGSASARSKSRARRVVVKSPAESPLSPTDQPSAVKAVKPSNEGSVKPTVAADKAGDKPADTTDAKDTEKPRDESPEPGDAKSLPAPAAQSQGTNVSNAFISMRDQIDAAPSGPERIRLQLKLAEQLVAADKKTEATTELHAITKADVFDPQGFYNAGNALARLGDSDEAITAYRKAINQRKGKYSRALNNLGVVLLREGRWDEAYDALLSALKLESFHYAEASYNLGRLYSVRGERDLAIREWRRALKVDAEHSGATHALAGAEAGTVEPSKRSSPPNTSNSAPEHPAGNTVVPGRPANNPAARSAEAAKVLTLDPVSFDFLQRARNLSEHGKPQEAVENYQKVISRSRGYFPPANLELSYVLMKLKRNDEALANLLEVMNRDGARYPISYYYLARLYEVKGDLILAEESFARAAMVYKTKNNTILLDLSRVRERRGDFKGALAAMEEYLAAMEQQGQTPSWADESLSALRQKVSNTPK